MLGLKSKTRIAGVKLWLKKDKVQSTTEFLHMHHNYTVNQQGIFPYLYQAANKPCVLTFAITSGFTRRIKNLRSVMLNAQGKIATWEGRIKMEYAAGRPFCRHLYWTDIACGTVCNAEWLEAFSALTNASAGVVRFSGDTRNFDFRVTGWNRRLVSDMMRVFDEIRKPGPKSAPASQQTLPPLHDAIPMGPLRLMPDGSIAIPSTNSTIPPNSPVGKIQVETCTVKSHPKGYYVLAYPDGTEMHFIFHGGRWKTK